MCASNRAARHVDGRPGPLPPPPQTNTRCTYCTAHHAAVSFRKHHASSTGRKRPGSAQHTHEGKCAHDRNGAAQQAQHGDPQEMRGEAGRRRGSWLVAGCMDRTRPPVALCNSSPPSQQVLGDPMSLASLRCAAQSRWPSCHLMFTSRGQANAASVARPGHTAQQQGRRSYSCTTAAASPPSSSAGTAARVIGRRPITG